jgi:hypothetical protein
MLTLYDFNSLDEKGKGEAVFMTGIFVDDRNEGTFKVQLYRLHDFYVEVYYDAMANEIRRYRAFKSASQLVPYLKM